MTLEDEQRKTTTCIACGDDKPIGNVVCWNCFKHRDNPYKYSELELEDWLKSIGIMVIPAIKTIRTGAQAEQLAIDWQSWQSEQNLSFDDLIGWQELFEKLGKTFNLTEEFQENGII